jgi:hypothetical protein
MVMGNVRGKMVGVDPRYKSWQFSPLQEPMKTTIKRNNPYLDPHPYRGRQATRYTMRRVVLKYLIDLGMVVTFILCFITGIIKFPGFLRFIGATRHVLPMRNLTLIHDWSGVVLGLLVLAHLVLNFSWIIAMTKQLVRRSS